MIVLTMNLDHAETFVKQTFENYNNNSSRKNQKRLLFSNSSLLKFFL